MNFDPKIWGPHAWEFMHYITIGYPDNPSEAVKQSAHNLFMSLKYLLPCESCRHNFSTHVDRRPLTDEILSSKNRLSNWLVDLHNDVNAAVGKPLMTYETAIKKYTNVYNKKNYLYNVDSRIYVVIVSILVIVILFVMLKYNIV